MCQLGNSAKRQAAGAFLSIVGVCVGVRLTVFMVKDGLARFFAESLKDPYSPEIMASAGTDVLLSIPAGILVGSIIVAAGLFVYDTAKDWGER